MLSRQKSGLLIFGDINVTGPTRGSANKDIGRGKTSNTKGVMKFHVVNEAGEISFVNGGMLHHVPARIEQAGRMSVLMCHRRPRLPLKPPVVRQNRETEIVFGICYCLYDLGSP